MSSIFGNLDSSSKYVTVDTNQDITGQKRFLSETVSTDLVVGDMVVNGASSFEGDLEINGTLITTQGIDGTALGQVFNFGSNIIQGSINGNAASATTVFTKSNNNNAAHYLTFSDVDSAPGANINLKTHGGITCNPFGNTITATSFQGELLGNATSATTATRVNVENTASGNPYYVLLSASLSGSSALLTDNSGLSFNSGTNHLFTNITGGASTATTAANVGITTDNTSGTYFVPFAKAVSSSQGLFVDDTTGPLSYNPATSNLTATTFTGALSGNAATATTAVNLNGGSVNATGANFSQLITGNGNLQLAGATATLYSGTTTTNLQLQGPLTDTTFGIIMRVGSGAVTAMRIIPSAPTVALIEMLRNVQMNDTCSIAGTLTTTGGITANAVQTIDFGTNAPTMSGNNLTYSNNIIPLAAINGGGVNIVGAQSITGVKTFTNTIVGNISGTAAIATTAANVGITTDNTSGTYFVPFAKAVSSSQGLFVDDTTGPLTYNPSTSNLTATTFTGALSGNATSATSVDLATTAVASYLVLSGPPTGQSALKTSSVIYNTTLNQLNCDITGSSATTANVNVTDSSATGTSRNMYFGGLSGDSQVLASSTLTFAPNTSILNFSGGNPTINTSTQDFKLGNRGNINLTLGTTGINCNGGNLISVVNIDAATGTNINLRTPAASTASIIIAPKSVAAITVRDDGVCQFANAPRLPVFVLTGTTVLSTPLESLYIITIAGTTGATFSIPNVTSVDNGTQIIFKRRSGTGVHTIQTATAGNNIIAINGISPVASISLTAGQYQTTFISYDVLWYQIAVQ